MASNIAKLTYNRYNWAEYPFNDSSCPTLSGLTASPRLKFKEENLRKAATVVASAPAEAFKDEAREPTKRGWE